MAWENFSAKLVLHIAAEFFKSIILLICELCDAFVYLVFRTDVKHKTLNTQDTLNTKEIRGNKRRYEAFRISREYVFRH